MSSSSFASAPGSESIGHELLLALTGLDSLPDEQAVSGAAGERAQQS
jgi:hypothetical protein